MTLELSYGQIWFLKTVRCLFLVTPFIDFPEMYGLQILIRNPNGLFSLDYHLKFYENGVDMVSQFELVEFMNHHDFQFVEMINKSYNFAFKDFLYIMRENVVY